MTTFLRPITKYEFMRRLGGMYLLHRQDLDVAEDIVYIETRLALVAYNQIADLWMNLIRSKINDDNGKNKEILGI